MDPFQKSEDCEIWDALESSYLKDFVASLKQRLEYVCGEGVKVSGISPLYPFVTAIRCRLLTIYMVMRDSMIC